MSAGDVGNQTAIDAYLHASILLETTIPGAVVDNLDGLTHIRYGRPRNGVEHEIIAGWNSPHDVLAVVGRHPEVAPAYISTFTPLSVDCVAAYEDAGLQRVVRITLKMYRLPDVAPFSDPMLRRLTDVDDLRALARIRGDGALDVEHVTDAIGCYVLEIDGDPVSSALLVQSTYDTAVVEHVQTLAAYRRRGYGRWLMRALHAEAIRLGLHRIVLGSNAAGRPLYAALGYVPLCHQDVYVIGQ